MPGPTVVAGIELPQGDPGAIDHAASSFTKASNDFASTGQTAQNAVNSVAGWQGVASITFRDRCGTYGSAAAAGERACDQAAKALQRFAKELEDAQNQVRDLQRQAQDCVDRIDAANARAASAAGHQNAASQRMERGGTAAAADGGAAMAAAAREYADAGNALRQAQGDASAASGELTQLQKRAAEISDRVRAQAKIAAGAVGAAAGGLPRVDFPGGAAPGAPAGGGGSGHDYWNDALLAFRLISSGAFIKGAYQYGPYGDTAASWVAAAGESAPLTQYANLLAQEHFPTFNNGLFGRGAGSFLRGMPGKAGDAGEFLGDASRATPFFTKVGIAGGVLGMGLGGYHTYQDFAQHKGGDDIAVDATGTAFSAATVAFLVFPEVGVPVVVIAGAAWGAAEAWKHRAAIGHALESTGKFIWDTSAPGLLWNNRGAIGNVLDDGADLASSGLHTAEDGLSKVGHVVNPLNW